MYRSKDKAFMEDIKNRVLRITKGLPNEERKFAIDYLRTHVRIDDLYQLARKKFPDKRFEFGDGSYVPKVVVLTKDPIAEEYKNKLNAAWRKLHLTEDDIYYAHLRFVKTKKLQEERKEIVEKLIAMLSPAITIVFDKLELTLKGEVYEVGDGLSILTNEDSKEERRHLTKKLASYKKQSVI